MYFTAERLAYFAVDSRQELWQNGADVSRLRTGKKRYLKTKQMAIGK
jgi:hypothetical protein